MRQMSYVKDEPHRLALGVSRPGHASVVHSGWLQWLMWFTVAISSIVFIEPAPYDLLVLLLVVLLFPLGLRVPGETGIPLLLLMLFAAGHLAAALAVDDPDLMLRPLSIRTYMLITWLFWTSLVVADPLKYLPIIWQGYAFAALFATGWGILQYFGFLPETLGAAFGRVTGPFKDANVFAPFLVPAILYYMERMLRMRGTALAFEAGKCLVLIYGLFLGFSRGAWLNLIVAFLLFMFLSIISARSIKEHLRLNIVLLAVGVAAVSTVYFAVAYTEAGQLFAERAAFVQEYDVAQGGRFDTQAKALAEIGRNPVGIGPGMSGPAFGGVEPHNLYLHVAVEGGWLAAISFYIFVLITLARAFTRINNGTALSRSLQIVLAALVGVLVQSLFIDSTHWRHLWLLMALTWAITITIDRGIKAE